MSTQPEADSRWPEHLPVGAVRIGRVSAHYDQTVQFYRDMVGLPVLESFEGSYGEDGTIFGLPDISMQLEIVRSTEPAITVDRIDTLVFYLPDAAARERLVARMAAAGLELAPQHPYWQANGGMTYRDPDGREVVFVSWVMGWTGPDRARRRLDSGFPGTTTSSLTTRTVAPDDRRDPRSVVRTARGLTISLGRGRPRPLHVVFLSCPQTIGALPRR
jgi:catechol 2,3-dioxygenase-like lactoylglutathione lyase family enzyme